MNEYVIGLSSHELANKHLQCKAQFLLMPIMSVTLNVY